MSKRWFWNRRKMESDMDEELRFHIDSYASDLMKRGLDKSEAFRRARIEFGAVERFKEECRESLGLRLWDELRANLRGGFRILRNSPLFTVVAVLSLALGVGANTAIFSAANSLLLWKVGASEPNQLRIFAWTQGPEGHVGHVSGSFQHLPNGGSTSETFPAPVFMEMRKNNSIMADIAAFRDLSQLTAIIDGNAEAVDALMVSGNFYKTLGLGVEAGRTIRVEDDGHSSTGVVVISDAYWSTRFGRSADVLGRKITLNSTPFTIVGVNRPEFTGLRADETPQFFFPLAMQQAVIPDPEGSRLTNDHLWWLYLVGRLDPSISDSSAAAGLAIAFRNACRATMPYRKEIDIPRFELKSGQRGFGWGTNQMRKPIYLLLAISGLVLLTACTNLANLLLARASVRQREISLRLAMGAGRSRVVRQVLTESMLLALLGGAAGLMVAYAGRNFIPDLLLEPGSSQVMNASMDWRVFLFALCITTITGLLFGIVPAWRCTQTNAGDSLKESGRMTTGRPKVLLGKALVTVQIALSLLLAVGAGLFLQTLANLRSTPTGMNTNNIVLFSLDPPRSGYSQQRRIALFQQVSARLAALPGVQHATSSSEALLAGNIDTDMYRTPEMPANEPGREFTTNIIGPNFFSTFGIPLLEGRGINLNDDQSARRVAVVNNALAQTLFPGRDAVGQVIVSSDAGSKPMEIVGVSGAAKYTDLRSASSPTIYIPFAQVDDNIMTMTSHTFEVKTAASLASLVPQIRRVVHEIDHNLPVLNVRTQTEQIEATLRTERMFATLTTGFGIIALLLAAIGIYGVMAYTVSRRTNEIGVRMALGAESHTVLKMVLGETTWLACIGIVAGVGSATVATRIIAAMLFGVKSLDPLTLVGSALTLLFVSLSAAAIPAWRAASVEPMNALRHE